MNKPGQQSSLDPQAKNQANCVGKSEDLLEQQNQAWLAGDRISIEQLLERLPPSADRESVIMDLICNEIAQRIQAGTKPSLSEYQRRFPALAQTLEIQWEIDRLLFSDAFGEKVTSIHPSSPDVGKNPAQTEEPSPSDLNGQNELGNPSLQRTVAMRQIKRVAIDGTESLGSIGHYRLETQIGRGGMGVVFRAIDFKLDRVVALKCIRNLHLATKDIKSRFEREAHSAARLSHRNIVTVYEYGCDNDVPYIAMEYVEGQSLAELLRLQEILIPNEAIALIRQIASAVGYAHDNGIIHRDLKPANILVDGDGVPRVADFGLARVELDFPKLTLSGDILGTPSYMSPEQAAGRVDSIGRPSDVYSLGAILYECLTGVPPFRAENPQLTLMQVIESSVIPPRKLRPEISRDMETVCMKCLAKLPEHRYANAHELVADLDRLMNEQPVRVRSWTASERFQNFIRENVVLVSVTAALIATLPVYFLVSARNKPTANATTSHPMAIQYLTSLIDANPSNAVAWKRRAVHRLALGEFASAKEDATKAQSLGYSHPEQVHLILGKCALHFQDYRMAEAEFSSVVSHDASCCEAWIGLGRARLKNDQPSEAIEDLTRAIELQPENGMAYELRAIAFEKTGALDKAKSDRRLSNELMRNSDSTN